METCHYYILPQGRCDQVAWIEDHLEETVQHETGWGFTRMNT